MELSKMFGVERDMDFMVEGLRSVYKIGTDEQGIERIERVDEGASKSEVVYGPSAWRVINAAPSGIIHLPPPLTDEQREQLGALYTLGYRWLAKDKYGSVYIYETKPYKKVRDTWTYDDGDSYLCCTKPTKCLELLVSWPDPEPFDIGKALGVEK